MAEAFPIEAILIVLALLTSLAALVFSILAWRSAAKANRAAANAGRASQNANQNSIFNRRYEIFEEAEKFVLAWRQQGRPDMTLLPMLIRAWNRSHFFFKPDVPQYLKRIWDDAVRADHCWEVIAGETAGNRQEANKEFHALLKWHGETANLCTAFMPHLNLADAQFSSAKPRPPGVRPANAPPPRPKPRPVRQAVR